MPTTKLTDKEAKDILRAWPARTQSLWQPPIAGAFWLRAQPVDGGADGPRLSAVGTETFRTQPDGLWVVFAPADGYADVVAIEVCGSQQNFNDKRSRYMPSTTARVVRCSLAWMLEEMSTRGGGRAARWSAAGSFASVPTAVVELPVRFMRVAYFLPDDVFTSWRAGHVPHGHEYVSRHGSLGTYKSQQMQAFLRRMTLRSHFYPATR